MTDPEKIAALVKIVEAMIERKPFSCENVGGPPRSYCQCNQCEADRGYRKLCGWPPQSADE